MLTTHRSPPVATAVAMTHFVMARRGVPVEIVTDYPKLPPPVVSGGPPMASGGLPWVVSTG